MVTPKPSKKNPLGRNNGTLPTSTCLSAPLFHVNALPSLVNNPLLNHPSKLALTSKRLRNKNSSKLSNRKPSSTFPIWHYLNPCSWPKRPHPDTSLRSPHPSPEATIIPLAPPRDARTSPNSLRHSSNCTLPDQVDSYKILTWPPHPLNASMPTTYNSLKWTPTSILRYSRSSHPLDFARVLFP